MKVSKVGDGKVVLIAGGGKVYTDIAARFCRTEKSLDQIISSEYDKKIVKNILDSNHLAATEFDYFLFGVEGYSRVTEVQLVRKRIASYLIKSGRCNKGGKRSFDIVLPNTVEDHSIEYEIHPDDIQFKLYDESPENKGRGYYDVYKLNEIKSLKFRNKKLVPFIELSPYEILDMIEQWYDTGVNKGLPEEDLRYMKPQATEFKALIGMNAHSLLDWFKIRTCKNAQTEIRDLAVKMMKLCKGAAPDLFANAGPSCVTLGYCPENDRQHPSCNIIKKDKALEILRDYYKDK